MKQRLLITYRNDQNLRCIRLIEETCASDEISEHTNPKLFQSTTIEISVNKLIVNKVAPGEGEIINYHDIDQQCWELDLAAESMPGRLTTGLFIETMSRPEMVKSFYDWISSTLVELH